MTIETGRRNEDLGGSLGLDAELAADLDALKDGLTVLVKLELVDDDVGGVDAEGDGLAGGLLAGDALDVDDVLEAVDGGDLALAALVGATDDGDLVVLADGDGANVVLLAELLGERGAHDDTTGAGGGTEVSRARLAAGGGDVLVNLGHLGCVSTNVVWLEREFGEVERRREKSSKITSTTSGKKKSLGRLGWFDRCGLQIWRKARDLGLA